MRLQMILITILNAVMLLLSAVAAPAGAQVPRETWSDIQKNIRQRQADEAITQIESLLASADISRADHAKLLDFGAQAELSRRPPQYEQAIVWLQRIVSNATLGNTARIDAIQRISDVQILQLGGQDLHEMDLSPAMATLAQPLMWQELSARDRARALVNVGKLHERQEAYNQAREHYTQALALVENTREQNDIHKLIVYAWAGQGDIKTAATIAKAHDVDLIDMYRQFGQTSLQHQACVSVLEDIDATDTQRWNAFRRLPAWHVYTRDLQVIRQLSEKYLPAFTQINEDRPRQVFMPLLRHMTADEHASFILWSAPKVLASIQCSNSEFALLSALMIEARALQYDDEKLTQQAATSMADPRTSQADLLWLSLVTRVLHHDVSQAIAWLDQQQGLSPSQQSDALLKAARTLLRAGHEQSARDLHAFQVSLLASVPPVHLSCEFVEHAPADIGQWLAWIERNPSTTKAMLDKPYGSNLQFLVETDSASSGRTSSLQNRSVTDDSRTSLYALCDDRGVHLFLLAYDSQYDQVESGKLRGGSFEMYLAPGKQQAYHTFLADVATGGYDPQKFITHYPTAYVHPLSKEDHTFESQTRLVHGAYATYLFMSWAAFYDKLPKQGDIWQFEAIRWTRRGGFSFGGSRSVHNRSSWGNLVFANLDDEAQLAIRKRIIPIAVTRYLLARQATSPAGNWADPELGDPAFHAQHVAPLFAMLEKAAKQSRETLTAAQVDELYLQAVPSWMDLEHHINHLRRDYLQQKLLQP